MGRPQYPRRSDRRRRRRELLLQNDEWKETDRYLTVEGPDYGPDLSEDCHRALLANTFYAALLRRADSAIAGHYRSHGRQCRHRKCDSSDPLRRRTGKEFRRAFACL